jgi:hypothetical protein
MEFVEIFQLCIKLDGNKNTSHEVLRAFWGRIWSATRQIFIAGNVR